MGALGGVPRYAWVLNLDADLELATLGSASPYAPKRTVRDAMAPWVALLTKTLLCPNDVVIDDWGGEDEDARGMIGRAFCPTPRAVAIMERAGVVPEPHPSAAVLRRVNGRELAASLGQTLDGAEFVTDYDAACAKLASASPSGTWRVKRSFGMTGRGQRVITAGAAPEADLAFVRASFDEGGVQIEPNVSIVAEYGIHGMLAQDSSLVLGALVTQRCDARGAWIATELVSGHDDALVAVATALTDEARFVARALAEAGYFGPFGIDAFTYRAPSGDVVLQRRSEINARYSMGFGIGFGRG